MRMWLSQQIGDVGSMGTNDRRSVDAGYEGFGGSFSKSACSRKGASGHFEFLEIKLFFDFDYEASDIHSDFHRYRLTLHL